MTFHELNILSAEARKQELFNCCASINWVNRMVSFFPMDDLVEMLEDAEEQWYECTEADWREALAHHQKSAGIDLRPGNFTVTAEGVSDEQRSADNTSREMIADLEAAHAAYEKKFGYIFVASTAGKTAGEMLNILKQRLSNTPEAEIKIAMDEQNKITLICLQKLIT
jgi:2-oxo-4-hydroxy-4-carboxy-5-ureidoimidazoline decarboxylase